MVLGQKAGHRKSNQGDTRATFFLLGASLSLGATLVHTGAAKWLAISLLQLAPAVAERPYFLFAVILGVSVPVRILVPNITGYLAITIPIAIEIGRATDPVLPSVSTVG